jgi:alkanesulfonate monooxygenase SsuD/methylene tetrahydromethanopterin reductase-like flavin-dependent oxidoreductase (luciferase family)
LAVWLNRAMQYGFIVTAGDPRQAAELARTAELAGWDAVFSWDGIAVGAMDTYDPWVVMAAMAMRTERVRIGSILTPPARRRPWKLAREAMTLDRLSGGRLVLPVGLGTADDLGFGNVGEPTDARVRAERLDESLEILDGLWSGERFGYQGRHYRFGPMTFRPTPIQRPRIPIWVAATIASERSLRRPFRYDGILPQTADLGAIRSIAERAGRERPTGATGEPFAIMVEGTTTPGDDASLREVRALADAGATWWVESPWNASGVDALRRRLEGGPPRVD